MGALCIFIIPLYKNNINRGWYKMKVSAARFLLKVDYCIHYSKNSALKNPKEFCSRAGRVNCADCIAQVLGVKVGEVLENDGKRRLSDV
jgi:hypothetical protein